MLRSTEPHPPVPASQTYKYFIVAVSSKSSFTPSQYSGSTYSDLSTHLGSWSSNANYSWINIIEKSYWPTPTVQQQPSCEPDAGHGLAAVSGGLSNTTIGLRWRAVVDNGMPIFKYQVRHGPSLLSTPPTACPRAGPRSAWTAAIPLPPPHPPPPYPSMPAAPLSVLCQTTRR